MEPGIVATAAANSLRYPRSAAVGRGGFDRNETVSCIASDGPIASCSMIHDERAARAVGVSVALSLRPSRVCSDTKRSAASSLMGDRERPGRL